MFTHSSNCAEGGKVRVFGSHIDLCIKLDQDVNQWYGSSSPSNTCRTMYNSFFFVSRLQSPLKEVIKHQTKIIYRILSLRYSMIRPTCEMNLCYILNITVWFCNSQFPSSKILFILFFFNKFNLDLRIIFIGCLWHMENLWFLSGFRPKSITFLPSHFDRLTSRDHHGDILFNQHLPKVISSCR